MAHPKSFIGKKFGYLTIKAVAKYRGTILHVECACDCGQTGTYVLENIERGKISSCGCQKVPGSYTFNENVRKKIESLIEVDGECWLWKGMYRTVNNRFYPFINSHGKQYNPVRWFARRQGDDININWNYVRQCDCDTCVNPDHHAKVSRGNIKKALNKEIKSEYIKRRELR